MRRLPSLLPSLSQLPLRVVYAAFGLTALLALVPTTTHGQSDRKLLAHWRFNEASGTEALDETGSYPGRLSPTGVTRLSQGIAGGALQFSRPEGGFVDVGDVLPLTNTPFSISGWFRIPVGEASPVAGILTKHRPGTGNGYGILFNEFNVPGAGERIASFVGDYGFVGDFRVPVSTSTVNDNAWHHFVLTYHPTNQIRLYLDGAPAESAHLSRPAIASEARLVIGGIDTGAPQGTFTGSLDELQIYNFELVDEEVAFLTANPGGTVRTQLDPVVISPDGGTFPASVTVSIRSGLQGAELRYTLDTTDPTATSTRYQGPIQVTPPTTLKARAFVNGFPVSEIHTAVFDPEPDIRIQPPGGPFTNLVDVTVTTRIPGAVVRYTVDGSIPTPASPGVDGPIRLTATTPLRARAFLNEFPVSQTFDANFVRIYADGTLPAAWLELHFGAGYATDPRVASNADPDLDGSTNQQEYVAGTLPLDPLSGFLAAIRVLPEVRFASVPGQSYRILRRTALPEEPPTVVATVTANGTTTTYLDTSASANTGFYVIEPVR